MGPPTVPPRVFAGLSLVQNVILRPSTEEWRRGTVKKIWQMAWVMSQFFARVLDVLIKFERLSWLSISAVPYHQITIKEWLPEIFPTPGNFH